MTRQDGRLVQAIAYYVPSVLVMLGLFIVAVIVRGRLQRHSQKRARCDYRKYVLPTHGRLPLK